jgi:hypothetical protein
VPQPTCGIVPESLRKLRDRSATVTPAVTVAIACAMAALVVAGGAVGAMLTLSDADPTVLIHMAEEDPLSKLAIKGDPGFNLVAEDAHYDGVYFYAIAIDPLALGRAHELIDFASYRYGHAGYGLLAWALSAGQERAVPIVLVLINLAAMAGAAAAVSVLAGRLGFTRWAGLLVALSPGLLYAVTVDTSEPLGAALLALALLAFLDRRWVRMAVYFVALSLTKEIFVLIPIVLIGWTLWRDRRRVKPRVLAALAAAPVVFGLWQIYLFVVFDKWALLSSPKILASPLYGWLRAMTLAARQGVGSGDTAQLGQAALPLIIAVAAALIFGIVRAAQMRFFLDPIYVGMAMVMIFLSPLGVLYPKDLFRLTAILFLLLPAVILGPRVTAMQAQPSEGRG